MKTEIKKVRTLSLISSCCPLQYQGVMETGEFLYIHERKDILTVYIGGTKNFGGADGELVYEEYTNSGQSVLDQLKCILDFSSCSLKKKKSTFKDIKMVIST